jgi:hypothetical protein
MSGTGMQRGTALVAALAVVMVLLPVGAFVVLQCRTDLAIQHNLRAEIEAFYVAEAGLEHALAEIDPGTSFDSILLGPDHVAGTADDGLFPFVEGVPGGLSQASLRYDVRVTRVSDDMVSVLSAGSALRGATKVVMALMRRAPLPATPAALYAEGDVSGLDMGSAGFLLSGLDHDVADPPSNPTGLAAPIPALSGAQVDADVLRQRLGSEAAQRLVGAGGAPSLAAAAPISVQEYAAACASHPRQVQSPAVSVGDSLALGTADAPQISVIGGDLSITGQVTGNGVLVVQGALQVAGLLSFRGLVFALGGIVFEPSSTVTISGGLWHRATTDNHLELRGGGSIVYSSSALAAIDAEFPNLLPHAAFVASWQEQL